MISRGILIKPIIHTRKGLVGGSIAFANVGNNCFLERSQKSFQVVICDVAWATNAYFNLLTNIGILKTFDTESSLHISITIDNLIIDYYTAIIWRQLLIRKAV